ncbi:MAG: FeoB-associated Cys-rich membrane protein [Bacteroidetes bacterium]|nr:FeoB-associated Cys-rich membrane protein [Bacteroidota bacterium]
MVQQVLLAVVTVAAVAYLGKTIYQSLHSKKSCATGCGKCAASGSTSKA